MKVVFFGLGGIGQRHLRIIKKKFPTYEIFCLKSKTRNFEIDDNLNKITNSNILKKYSVKQLYSLKEVREIKPDIAFITNPTFLHSKFAKFLSANKISFFVEKPFSNNEKNYKRIFDDLVKFNKKFYVGYMLRFHPQLKILKRYVDSGNLGDIFNVNINVNSFMPSWHKYELHKNLYASKKKMGGGVILTECHEIDLMNNIFSNPKVLNCYASKLSSFDLDAEDTSAILISYTHNRKKFICNIQMSFVQKNNSRTIEIFGSDACILWDINKSKIEFYDNNKFNLKKNIIRNFNRNILFSNQIDFIFDDIYNKNTKEYKYFTKINHLTHRVLMQLIKVRKNFK
tara:strand:- start:17386 stop:18411 length:1026 start_codon:yes stop_codon:yes gene_type:complete